MNTSTRGEKQTESIVLRCTESDKSKIQLLADQQGTSISDIIRRTLIDAQIIDAKYAAF